MTTETLEKPELEEAVDTPDDVQDSDGGADGPAFLISYLDNSLEVVELAGTEDEDTDVDELVERFDKSEQKGATFVRIGRRRIRITTVRSIGPEDECDYPEVAIFSSLEERTEKLLKGVEQALGAISQSAQGTAYLTQQQAALQQAQAELFSAIQAEEEFHQEEAADAPEAPQQPRAGKKAPKAPGTLKPLRVPGMPSPQQP